MKDMKQLLYIGGAFLFLLALVVVTRTTHRPQERRFPDVSLARLDGGEAPRLESCSTPKCLTIYVAPWCGVCVRSTPFLKTFRTYLTDRGVETRVIVGQGAVAEVRAYAKEFGPDTLIDPQAKAAGKRGVPNFTVSDNKGRILTIRPGVPKIYTPPFAKHIFQDFAQYLGLP